MCINVGKEVSRPNYLDMSGHYLHDAIDFEMRYKFCINSDGPVFNATRSGRAKCFIDLRMGLESILKSLVCYYEAGGRVGKPLINWIEKLGHNIDKLLKKLKAHMAQEWLDAHEGDFKKLKLLPVGLRYRLDAWNFEDNKAEIYDTTIGSEVWMDNLHMVLNSLIEKTNELLSAHRRILSGKDLISEASEIWYEKHTY